MADRKPKPWELNALRLWHAWVMGGFIVAYLTADEDTYFIHQFSGYAVLAALALRLAVGAVLKNGPWALPRPSFGALLRRLAGAKGRHPLFAWFASALLTVVGVSALTGALADGMGFMEDPHEAASQAALWVIGGHIAFVFMMYGGKRRLTALVQRLSARKESAP